RHRGGGHRLITPERCLPSNGRNGRICRTAPEASGGPAFAAGADAGRPGPSADRTKGGTEDACHPSTARPSRRETFKRRTKTTRGRRLSLIPSRRGEAPVY